MPRLLLALLFCVFASAASAGADRLVARFDFEDTNDAGVKLGSGLTLPRSWAPIGRDPGTGDPAFATVPVHREAIRRRGHPVHNPVGYAADPHDPGGFVLRLGVLGGDVGAYLAAGAVPAEPGGSYRVTLSLRPLRLEYASPRVRAYFIDRRGRRLPGTTVEAAPAGESGEPGEVAAAGPRAWSAMLVAPAGNRVDVASVGLEVSLRQPVPDPADPLGAERVLGVETEGALLVDDVEIRRMPVATLRTGGRMGVVRLPERPEIRLRVRDLGGERLRARLAVRDLDGRVVAEALLPAVIGEEVAWSPKLPGLGWYEAAAEVVGPAGEVLLRRRSAFVHARPGEPAAGGAGGGLAPILFDATALGLPLRETIAAAEAVALPGVVLPGWTRNLTPGAVAEHAEALGEAAAALQRRGRGLEVALGPVPDALARLAEPGVSPFGGPGSRWMPWLEPLVLAVGGRASAWWVADPSRQAEPGAAAAATAVPSAMERLVNDWAAGSRLRRVRAADAMEGGGGDAVRVAVAAGEAAQDGVRALSTRPPVGASRRVAVASVVAELLAARLGPRPAPAAVGGLFRVDGSEARPTPSLPAAERFAAWTAGDVAPLPWRAGPGVEAWVLADDSVLAWASGPERATLPLDATPDLEVEDLWGNRWSPRPEPAGVPLGRLPLRVSGLPSGAARLAASFTLDRPEIETLPGPQRRRVRFTNPHAVPIRGEARLEGPAGWSLRPATLPFRLGPGESAYLPVEVEVPINASGGPATLRGRLRYERGEPREVTVSAPVDLGLEGLRLQAALGTVDDGADLLATCVAFNVGAEPASLSVFAQAAGRPFAERLAPRVPPGGFVVFRFRFPDASALADAPVLCGVRRSGRPGSLNRHLRLGSAE